MNLVQDFELVENLVQVILTRVLLGMNLVQDFELDLC